MEKRKKAIKAFPDKARQEAGYQLNRVQHGLEPSDWKPMTSVGSGVIEIRLHRPFEHRVLYVAKFEEGIYALHAFTKKTQKTQKRDLEIAKKAYSEVLKRRKK